MTPQTGESCRSQTCRGSWPRALRSEAQHQLELAVADALKAGGSVREVAASTGISTTTVQTYSRAHG